MANGVSLDWRLVKPHLSLGDDKSRSALCLVLAEDQRDWSAASQLSLNAFELADRWTGLAMTAVLQGGTLASRSQLESQRDRPLAVLLTEHSGAQPLSFVPVLKALLILSLLRLSGETVLIDEVAKGAAKVASASGNWHRLLPDRAPGPITEHQLQEAIQRCIDTADAKRIDKNVHLTAPQRDWLNQLHRWAARLRQSLRARDGAPVTALPPQVVVPVPPSSWPPDEDEPPFGTELLAIEMEADLPDQEPGADGGFDLAEDGLEASADIAITAEPKPLSLWSRPTSMELESAQGGESRRTRTGFRSALENQDLIWANRQLTPNDQRELVAALSEQLSTLSGEVRDAVGLLAFAHVTGQQLGQVLELRRLPSLHTSYVAGRVYMRFVAPPKDPWIPTDAQRRLLRTQTSHVAMDLPEVVGDWLQARWSDTADVTLGECLGLNQALAESRTRECLEALRQRTGGAQTLSRAEWWLPAMLTRVGYGRCPPGDHVPSKLLCAVMDGLPAPATYYRAYRTEGLSAMHRQALSDAGWVMPVSMASSAVPGQDGSGQLTEMWVGTALNVDVSILKSLWQECHQYFSTLAADVHQPLHVRHNARETYECLALMFQSFHRAVQDPFESLQFLDLERGLMVIDDKSQAETRAHRLVALCDLAIRQCTDHIDHIRRLASATKQRAPRTSRRLLDIVEAPESRAAPFRFYLSESLEIVRITPAELRAQLQRVWPLPLNAGRHLASTWLLDHGVDDAALCAAAGHQNLGTQSLSYLSPLSADTLYERMRPLLNQWVDALGMQAIPSFMASTQPARRNKPAKKTSKPMAFGRERRAVAREQRAEWLRARTTSLVAEYFGHRLLSDLTQADVTALFDRLAKDIPNARSHAARVRREALRDVILKVALDHEIVGIEVPAVHLSVKDAEIICPLDCLSAHRWLQALRRGADEARQQSWRAWRKAPFVPAKPDIVGVLLRLVVDGLVLDPLVWSNLLGKEGALRPSFDEEGRPVLRLGTIARNSRLYPLQQTAAETLLRYGPLTLTPRDLEDVAVLANQWAGVRTTCPPVVSFAALLDRVRSAYSTEVPGIVLGYADGTHAAVSPEVMCLERADGLPPSRLSVEGWHAAKRQPTGASIGEQASLASTPEAESGAEWADVDELMPVEPPVAAEQTGELKSADKFRAVMREVIQSLDRVKKPPKSAQAAGLCKPLDSKSTAERAPGRQRQPLVRARELLASRRDELMGSTCLPPVCALSAQWMEFLLSEGAYRGSNYSPKTVRNYWSSWGVRLVEQFGELDPRGMEDHEFEDTYLSMIEELDEGHRVHLYPPLRNWHRYLVAAHGVADIDWDEIRQACGAKAINANLVHPQEYQRALALLDADDGATERVRAIQTASLVLMYRFGLRMAEVNGLLSRDLVRDAASGTWLVRVRRNAWRRLKSTNARRVVPCLEVLSEEEQAMLLRWQTHVQTFQAADQLAPLFASTQTGNDSLQLFPRHIVAQRIAQALRAASGDPSLRVHHCRHSYATRLLSAVAGQRDPSSVDLQMLVYESSPSRRAVWAVASILGHASPLTTLQTYSHAGHAWLQAWLDRHQPDQPSLRERFMGMAWATGMQIKSAQKAAQRVGEGAWETRYPALIGKMLTHRPRMLERVELSPRLPARALPPAECLLVVVDRLIDRARRQDEARPLRLGMFLDEMLAQAVLNQAMQFAASKRNKPAQAQDWWCEPADMAYSLHEQRQVDAALERLRTLTPERRAELLEVVGSCLDPVGRMLVVDDVTEFQQCAEVLRLLVDGSSAIEVLVPEVGDEPAETLSPRSVVRELQEAARVAEFCVVTHQRVRAHPAQVHNRFKPTVRVGLRIGTSSDGRIRSAKVMTRVLVTAVVAERALSRFHRGMV